MISDSLASILRSNRADFNNRFAEARRRFPGLTGEAFTAVLLDLVDPVVKAVAAVDADSAAETTSVAYDAALELAGQNLAGPMTQHTAIAEGWRRLLPAAARFAASAPRRVLPAVSNALHHLAVTPGAHSERWISGLARLANQCASADEFLKLGQVAAWRCGLAHYRTGALRLLEELPETVVRQVLGCPVSLPPDGGELSPPALHDILSRLANDRWYNPSLAQQEQESERLRPVARAGAFRGFGGLFIEPPRVAAHDGSILVASGGECWLLTADCFGATFHRCDLALFAAADKTPLPDGIQISGVTIRHDGFSLKLSQLGAIATAAATADTLALTSPLTYAVVLVALK